MTEAAPQPVPKPVEPPKPAIKLPVALIVSLVGAGLFLIGSLLDFYDGVSGSAFDTMSGKVGICLILLSVILVAIKKFKNLAAIAVSLALGGVLSPAIDAVSGDNSVINLVNDKMTGGASAGIGLYAALFGAIIALLAIVMVPKKKDAKK